VTMIAALAAALTVLTEALDDPDTDIAHSLQVLTLDAAAAISSHRGLSVVVPHSDPPLTLTVLVDGAVPGDVRTSLRFTFPGHDQPRNSSAVVIILYAGSPGAFVDLAADMAWLTGRPPSDFVLDEHVGSAATSVTEGQLRGASAINQAIGALIGRGYTPHQADWHLDVYAANDHTDRYTAARHILADITSDGDGHVDVPNQTQRL
jgi:hypothetical protein